jgi:type IV secretion system protein VirB6
MSACPSLSVDDVSGVSAALQVVDCTSAEAAQLVFARLFGPGGGLGVPLTILLTLYVAFLGINMLTGRSRLGVSMLTPRMLLLGLVLTFVTSWVAYQSVVWTLLTAGPDEIASIVTGQKGSATAAFGARLDSLFLAVASAADAAAAAPPAEPTAMGITPAPPQAAGWTPVDVLWMAAMLLLLGTVGVLLVARIALAVLLALGPIFIVFALFRGTHGLFVGWLKGAVMFALVPLFTVLVGGAALALLGPVVEQLQTAATSMRPAATMFVGAAVYVALMIMVLRITATIVSGWRIGSVPEQNREPANAAVTREGRASSVHKLASVDTSNGATKQVGPERSADERVRAILVSARMPANDMNPPTGSTGRARSLANAQARYPLGNGHVSPVPRDSRIQKLGASLRVPVAPPLRKSK